jgi:hypothetical protein
MNSLISREGASRETTSPWRPAIPKPLGHHPSSSNTGKREREADSIPFPGPWSANTKVSSPFPRDVSLAKTLARKERSVREMFADACRGTPKPPQNRAPCCDPSWLASWARLKLRGGKVGVDARTLHI